MADVGNSGRRDGRGAQQQPRRPPTPHNTGRHSSGPKRRPTHVGEHATSSSPSKPGGEGLETASCHSRRNSSKGRSHGGGASTTTTPRTHDSRGHAGWTASTAGSGRRDVSQRGPQRRRTNRPATTHTPTQRTPSTDGANSRQQQTRESYPTPATGASRATETPRPPPDMGELNRGSRGWLPNRGSMAKPPTPAPTRHTRRTPRYRHGQRSLAATPQQQAEGRPGPGPHSAP